MKVLILNGSPHAQGNTALAIQEMTAVFQAQGIETEIIHGPSASSASTENAGSSGQSQQTSSTASGDRKFCTECGTPNPKSAKFCQGCGHKF